MQYQKACNGVIGNEQTKALISDLHTVIYQINDDHDHDISDHLLQSINCKYYECQDFLTLTFLP